jgi:dipeptidyl aminopeptidase/acylaminoacyl peptidase
LKRFACGLLVLLSGGPAVAKVPLTARLLQTLPRISECQISPDGKWIAVATSQTEPSLRSTRSELRVYPFSLKSLGAPAARFSPFAHPRWSRDSTRLLMEGASRSGPGIQVFVCSIDHFELRQVTHQPAGVSGSIWAPNGRRIAFVGEVAVQKDPLAGRDSGRLYTDTFLRRWRHYWNGKRAHLLVCGLNGKVKDATPGDLDAAPTSSTFSSGDNFCFSADSQALLYAAPPAHGQATSTGYEVFRVAVAGGAARNLTPDNPAADLGPRLSPDGHTLYILSTRRVGYESDFQEIRRCSVDDAGNPTSTWETLTLGSEGSVDDFIPTRHGSFYSQNRDGATKGFQETTAIKSRGSLGSLSADQYGDRWAAIESSLSQPPYLVLGSGDRRLACRPDAVPDLALGAVESIEVPLTESDGGGFMQMWIVKPPHFRADRRWPVAFLIHGGPQGGWLDDWAVRWNAQLWAAQGYVVALPNPRGSSGRSKLYQEQVSRDWGGRPYRDLMTGVDWLSALPYVDSGRMLAAGGSYGGYMVNWIAVHNDRFKALVTHDGVWDLESMYGTTDETWFPEWELGGPPWGPTEADYAHFSPHHLADRLGRFRTPHLVIHNDLDYRCPINQGLELFTALQKQGVPSSFLNFPDEGHWVVKPLNSLRWYREVFAFVERYCAPGPSL